MRRIHIAFTKLHIITASWVLLEGLVTTSITAVLTICFAAMLLIFPIVALIYYNLPGVKHPFER